MSRLTATFRPGLSSARVRGRRARLSTIGVTVMVFRYWLPRAAPVDADIRARERGAPATLLPPVSLDRIRSVGRACATAIVIRPAMRNVTGAPRVSPRIRGDLFNQLNAGKRIDLDAQCVGSGEPECYGMDGYVPAAVRGMQLRRDAPGRCGLTVIGRAGRADVGTNSVRSVLGRNGSPHRHDNQRFVAGNPVKYPSPGSRARGLAACAPDALGARRVLRWSTPSCASAQNAVGIGPATVTVGRQWYALSSVGREPLSYLPALCSVSSHGCARSRFSAVNGRTDGVGVPRMMSLADAISDVPHV